MSDSCNLLDNDSSTSPSGRKLSVTFDSSEPDIYRYESLQYDFDQIHKNGSNDDIDEYVTTDTPRRSNSSIFYSILDHIINMLSDGTRFKCFDALLKRCCSSCKPLQKLLSTYIDLATLQDIVNQRNKFGICGHIYCNNHLSKESLIEKKKSRSTYKIDLATKNIYKRSVYHSFCCPQCIDDSKSVKSIIANSPMETGAITPRAMRCANNSSLERLYDNVVNIPKCSGSNGIDMSTLQLHEAVIEEPKIVDDVVIKENMDEPETKISKCPFVNTSSEPEPDSSNDRVMKCPLSIYKRPKVVQKCIDLPKDKITTASSNNDYLKFESHNKELLYNNLSLFSILLCTFNNFVTGRTKRMLIFGSVDQSDMETTAEPIYESCMELLTDELTTILDSHIKNLLSTFNIARITLPLSKKGYEVLAIFILYILLDHRISVSILVDTSSEMLLDETKHNFKKRLIDEFNLDDESISILSKLFIDD